jgi:hypothetical protein
VLTKIEITQDSQGMISHFERLFLIVGFCKETDENLYKKFQIEN